MASDERLSIVLPEPTPLHGPPLTLAARLAAIPERTDEIDHRWWGVHTSIEYHPDGTERRILYGAAHRHAGDDIGWLIEQVKALVVENQRLATALIEREARIIWEYTTHRSWRLAKVAERDEFRGYARTELAGAGLLPTGEGLGDGLR